ncbi:GyrI-like domain-containing protein [Neobacillus niacini]|uniref:GyrI-like domain-containing protein n=1 Tax=Neobacillus niacini TaxID=86668 RepID=UPI0039833708
MKYEWRKKDKELYLPGAKPSKLVVPPIKYFTLTGKGNPNSEAFKESVEALYALSYAIRMMPKKGTTPEGYFEYTVFPLEGVWDLDEIGRQLDYLDKDRFVYKLMIRQPDFVTEDLFLIAKELSAKKVSKTLLESAKFEVIEEGLCVQSLHLGDYDSEPETFSKMHDFCSANHLTRIDKRHREVYISDPRKTEPAKLKTVLRFKVK